VRLLTRLLAGITGGNLRLLPAFKGRHSKG
jgi:hypothetical protein